VRLAAWLLAVIKRGFYALDAALRRLDEFNRVRGVQLEARRPSEPKASSSAFASCKSRVANPSANQS
jgi:hypothetical protein